MLLGVDVGGTFTDAVLIDELGVLHTAKVPSTPAQEERGVMHAIELVLARAGAAPSAVERFAHGMTVATNALLEGKVARTALVATAGFTDVIELGRQDRPQLYRLCEGRPEPIVPAQLRFGVEERMGPEGPLRALERSTVEQLCELVRWAQPRAVAVSLLHSYADAAHELEIGARLRALLPDAVVSLSSDLVGTFREFERTATTVLDAALSPALSSYLSGLRERAADTGLGDPQIMQSSGGLVDSRRAGEHAALTLLSGPAGGVAGALLLAARAGEPDVACFDMGGTSCDVCLIEAGQVAETAERVIAGRPVALPALDIHTVGAGGGSIAWRDAGGALRVGPTSAGAEPGPACYGRGGELPTVTDANLVLGRLLAEAPLADGLELDALAAERAVAALACELGLDTTACALGIVRVAEAEMLAALRLVTVERGIDPRTFALMPFGGAGPLHAASMAETLGVTRVLCPRSSGVLSALGLAAGAPRRDRARTVMLRGQALQEERLEAHRRELLDAATEALGQPVERIRVRFELRYRGQSFELPVEEQRDLCEPARLGPVELRAAFDAAHAARYGYRDERAEMELVNLRVSAWGHAPRPHLSAGTGRAARHASRAVLFAEGPLQTAVLVGEPEPGLALGGPALFALPESTLLVPPAWSCTVDADGTIALERSEAGR
jgi:N-methylhydantoinase A